VQVLPPVGGRADVLVGFTGHFVLAAAVDADEVAARVPTGDFSVPMSVSFLSWLSGRLGRKSGTLDAVLAAPGTGEGRASGSSETTTPAIRASREPVATATTSACTRPSTVRAS
jgi:hypothetical protein